MSNATRDSILTAFEDREIHLWCVRLNGAETTIARLHNTLAADEKARAARFHFEIHRKRYVLARGLLRVLLGRTLGKAPSDIEFTYGPQGKPAMADDALGFNLSHSEDVALYAVAPDLELGVDVERIRPMPDAKQIAHRFFSAEECEQLTQASEMQIAEAFFRCWTRKEAYVKAVGGGLSVPLDRFQVSLLPGDACRLVHIEGDPQKAAQWSMLDLQPFPGYAGALAVHARGVRLQQQRSGSVEELLVQPMP